MTKLPNQMYSNLKAALASGKLPEDSSTREYDVVYDTFGELAQSLLDDWTKPSVSQTRREVSALVGFWEAIPFDGVLIGVAVNQPAIVPASIQAAKSMRLGSVTTLLEEMQSHVPASVIDIEDAEGRIEWYESEDGRGSAAALAQIEEKLNEGDFAEQLLLGVFQRVLAEPEEFFKVR